MTLPALPRATGLGAAPQAQRSPLNATIVALAPDGSKYLRVRLDGDSVAAVLARLVDGAALVPALGARVRCEMVGLEMTVVRGA